MWRPRKKFSLATRLKEARIEKGLWMDKLTKVSNVSYLTYQKIESWVTDNPTIKNLARIAWALEVSIDELVQDMEWEDKESKDTKKK